MFWHFIECHYFYHPSTCFLEEIQILTVDTVISLWHINSSSWKQSGLYAALSLHQFLYVKTPRPHCPSRAKSGTTERDQYIFIILFKYRLDILSNKLETGSIDLDSNRMCGRFLDMHVQCSRKQLQWMFTFLKKYYHTICIFDFFNIQESSEIVNVSSLRLVHILNK